MSNKPVPKGTDNDEMIAFVIVLAVIAAIGYALEYFNMQPDEVITYGAYIVGGFFAVALGLMAVFLLLVYVPAVVWIIILLLVLVFRT